jgi:hypothetical protein
MKLLILTIFTLLASTQYNSVYGQTLPSIKKLFKKHVFVDFKTAQYEINIDLKNKTVSTKSHITFNQEEDGHIIFDLKKICTDVTLDQKKVKIKKLIISKAFTMAKTISTITKAGIHTLTVNTNLTEGISFKEGFEMGLWMRDLFGRKFLEQYLPTNFEFDQYKANLVINITGGDISDYVLMVNGKKSKTKTGFIVNFPEFYTASSFFIHLFQSKNYKMNISEYTRKDGKKIDFVVYSKDEKLTTSLKNKANNSVKELEVFYGSWPHDYLIVFGDQDAGGMEHAGATQTSLGSLDHELHHSYFSRAVLPRNGNAGWMDEAIVTWRDRGYPLNKVTNFKKHNLGCHSVFRRSTDWDSYKKGGNFIGHLAYLYSVKGIDFKEVLREYFHAYKFQVVTTKTFRLFLEQSYGESLKNKFKRYVCNNKISSDI